MKNKKKLLIFDFDGTLADTKKIWQSILPRILKKEKIYYPELEAKLIVHFGKKVRDVLNALEVPEEKIRKIEKEVYNEALEKMDRANLCQGIEKIMEIKVRKIILSNTPTKIVNKVVKKYKLNFFYRVYGSDKFKGKSEFIKKLTKKTGLKKSEIFYIGDRAGDVKVAKDAGVVSVIVASKYAWNSKHEILEAKPDFIVGSLGEIEKLV